MTVNAEPPPAPDRSASTTRSVFRSWETLRLAYNGILIPLVVFLLFWTPRDWDPGYPPPWVVSETGELNWPLALVHCAIGGVFSNLCFFLGPAVEAYAAWLGWRSPLMRYGLFLLGTLFTAVVAAEFVWTQLDAAPGFG